MVYGLFPATVLPDELRHMSTRVIFLYIRLSPPPVSYVPDMHRILAPLLYVAMRDPEHGVRDTLFDRELHIAATGYDEVEAQVVNDDVTYVYDDVTHSHTSRLLDTMK